VATAVALSDVALSAATLPVVAPAGVVGSGGSWSTSGVVAQAIRRRGMRRMANIINRRGCGDIVFS
jgi:hypothetical protein